MAIENDNFSRISGTALLCLEARAKFTDLPYVKEMFNYVYRKTEYCSSLLFDKIMKNPSSRKRISTLETSYVAINEILMNLNHPVIEIAAGLSPRGLEFSDKVPYMETDLPDMISLKKEIAGKIKPRSSHYFASLNIIDKESFYYFFKNLPPDFDGKPVAVVSEGLMMYFSEREKVQMRDNLAGLSKIHNNAVYWVTTDFSARDTFQDDILIDTVMKNVEKSTKRKLNRFSSDADVRKFLNSASLKGKVFSIEHIADKLSCLDKLDIPKDELRDILHLSRPWVIQKI